MNKKPSRKAASQDKEIANLAAIEFEGSPELRRLLGTRDDWKKRMSERYPNMLIACAFLEKDAVALTADVQVLGVDCCANVVDCLADLEDYFTGLGKIVGNARWRILAALARTAQAAAPINAGAQP